MSTSEQQFSDKLVRYLDNSCASLRQGTAYRLQVARQAALLGLADSERITVSGLATAGAGGVHMPASRSWQRLVNLRTWVLIVMLAASGLYFNQWRINQQINEIEDLDTAILSSDLPIDAYLDRGFQIWVRGSDH